MITKNSRTFVVILTALSILSILLSSCAIRPTSVPTLSPTTTIVPSETAIPATATETMPTLFPAFTLKPGDFYFSIDGKQSFLLSRNVAGNETSHYDQLLDWTSNGGSKFVRLHLDSFGMGCSKTGKVDGAWARKWESVFDRAASNGMSVIPVFGVWYDWDTGNDFWKSNPLNEKNGGPVKTPGELFIPDSPTQELWLQWLKTLVERWQGRENILAWEIFSEVNMVPGVTETPGIYFVNRAASIIRSADSHHRPITASLAENSGWSNFYRSDAIDFINIHPYPVSGELDREIIAEAHSRLAEYHKPVMIGEAGLSFRLPDSYPATLTTAERAAIGIKHAIWASVVSGAMNGRSLWWEDGVAIYFPSVGWPFLNKYADTELPTAKFVEGIDFSKFEPLTSRSSGSVFGAVVGNEKTAIGWFRDANCEPPAWPLQPMVSKQIVTIVMPGTALNWRVVFYSTETGTHIIGSAIVTRQGNSITITFPDFMDDIAFKMNIQK